jgi:ketosteroid isomerase-like protein
MSENGDRVRAFYEGAASGPPDMEVFHEDVAFRMPEVLPHGGTIRGRDALGAYFGEVISRWDGFRAALDDLVDGGERVVALGRFCGTPKASGRYVEVPFALVWTMRGGQAVEVDEYTDTALLLEALRPSGAGGA